MGLNGIGRSDARAVRDVWTEARHDTRLSRDLRRRFRVWQRVMDASRFVFLDETGTATNMTRRYGRSPRGQRVVDAVPHGHWLTTTVVAGLRETAPSLRSSWTA